MAKKYPIVTWFVWSYEQPKRLMRFLEGMRHSDWKSMYDAMEEQYGNPRLKGLFNKPDQFIPLALSGDNRALAERMWAEANIVPWYSPHSVKLMTHNRLADWAEDDIIKITDKGRLFLENDEATLAQVDRQEGLLDILSAIAEQGSPAESDILGAFRAFFRAKTTMRNTGKGALNGRLENLLRRGLIEKQGNKYRLTESGREYLGRCEPSPITPPSPEPQPKPKPDAIDKLATEKTEAARKQLFQFLQAMDPYAFEHIIKLLLVAMGYNNVKVTAATNDKGVDVVADIELGISRVREVIQVKRQKSNVGIQILNQLRGSIPLFHAARGSIITLGGFTHQAKSVAIVPNVSPITLIDGERLLDLLIEHKIGVRWREIRMLEFNPDSLAPLEPEAGEITR